MSDEEDFTALKTDFDALVSSYENDRFEKRLLNKLGTVQRRRAGIICFASGLGAALAVAQFGTLIEAVSPALSDVIKTGAYGLSANLLTSLVFAALFVLTVGLVRQES